MNPFRWSYRVTCLVGFFVCAALLGYALYAEHVLGMIPCPLCIFQRIAFLVMAVFFLVGGLHAPRGAGRWVYAGGVLLGAAGGIATAARHLWLQTLPADQIPSCGPNLGYMMDTFPFAKVLKMVFTGSGECAKIEPVFGLPMPAWTLGWYLLLLFFAIYAAARKRSPHS
ncbi:disulfide bond formation protein B [Dyella soli]|uniref:Disulfide bond formation protein B n=1 Tax=Dyella soli TaxID=522319 RepID=A0A4V2NLK9_9GAMM|nr:disulfide bond formation protein B [Dyella soli]TCI09491.1 disulfide bond formation protein B [Dyella soli]